LGESTAESRQPTVQWSQGEKDNAETQRTRKFVEKIEAGEEKIG
jgi:hypothetical protein